MKIAIFYYGITRGLEVSKSYLDKNIYEPLLRDHSVASFGVFFKVSHVVNERSRENHELNYFNFRLLNLNEYRLLDPLQSDHERINSLKVYGDCWKDNFKSLSNITMQLFSIKKCISICNLDDYDAFLFLRPDLIYHDSIMQSINLIANKKEVVIIPNWQHWSGFNDRFFFTNSKTYARILGKRYDYMLEFCKSTQKPFDSEAFMRWVIDEYRIPIRFTNIKASRIRTDYSIKQENFENNLSTLDQFLVVRRKKKLLRNILRFIKSTFSNKRIDSNP